MEKEQYHVVSFSGGKDSTAMLLMMLEKGMKIDEVVFCDTGLEFPDMYDHIDKVEAYIGRKITRLKADRSFEYWAFEHVKVKGKTKGEIGYGWPSMRIRWCTDRLKTSVINRYFKEKRKTYDVVQYVAIAADEEWRVKNEHYPLVEWGITEKQALQYCFDKGFDWNGLYDNMDRVSCWCCPLQSLKELKVLHDHYPDLWAKLKEMDSRTDTQFRRDYSVDELEKRFENENA